ncbi:gamma-butyrobetaine dioxygenase [Gracilinanus agilis]|uniref:gamma-butyrobetaine dioxygenase n=1 Tax=Gracilinanus agilis TaxID=191870 RepID=UPI001CFE36E8|nr:gamma-butyrobetaine dioxygenase [Gracilinanus agilis]
MSSAILKVEALDAERLVRIRWDDGEESLYPAVWLRDNCQCPRCYLDSAKARKLLIEALDVNTWVKNLTLLSQRKVHITWPDEHVSDFEADWLKKRCFSQKSRAKLQKELFLPALGFSIIYMDANKAIRNPYPHIGKSVARVPGLHRGAALFPLSTTPQNIVCMPCPSVQPPNASTSSLGCLREWEGKKSLCQWLIGARLRALVVSIIPPSLCKHMFLLFYRHTWQVQDKIDANNVAYTTGKLSFHTDYPALHHPPGVQFLHCIKQTATGGESEIVDGFNVCRQLKEQNSKAFQILSSTFVDFTDIGVDFCDFSVQSKHKIIEIDNKGQVIRINFNNSTRDTIFDIPVEKVQPFYAALKEFVNLMNHRENKFIFKMHPGDVITFDNWRLLHGRRSYEAGTEISRHLEGGYADWDVVMSRLRILKKIVKNGN